MGYGSAVHAFVKSLFFTWVPASPFRELRLPLSGKHAERIVLIPSDVGKKFYGNQKYVKIGGDTDWSYLPEYLPLASHKDEDDFMRLLYPAEAADDEGKFTVERADQ